MRTKNERCRRSAAVTCTCSEEIRSALDGQVWTEIRQRSYTAASLRRVSFPPRKVSRLERPHTPSAVRARDLAAEAGRVERGIRGIRVFSEPLIPHGRSVYDVLHRFRLELPEGCRAGWKGVRSWVGLGECGRKHSAFLSVAVPTAVFRPRLFSFGPSSRWRVVLHCTPRVVDLARTLGKACKVVYLTRGRDDA